MLLGATVVVDAGGEVGVTGGTPTLQVGFFLSAKNTNKCYFKLMIIILSFCILFIAN